MQIPHLQSSSQEWIHRHLWLKKQSVQAPNELQK